MTISGSLVLSSPLVRPALAAPADPADAVQAFGGDVYEIVGSTLRHPTDTTDPSATLYTDSGIRLERSPGVGLTWGDWSAATATSYASVSGGRKHPHTDVDLTLSGLIPGGVYSIFWGTLTPDSEQTLCPGVERTLPLDAVKPAADAPDANSFVVGSTGTAEYHGRADGDLFDALQVFFTVVYHFSGQTAYPFPNLGEKLYCHSSFGEDAMRQLLVLQKW
jgi:hypothetical protein